MTCFPKNGGTFLLGDDRIRAAFTKYHADLLTPDFWNTRKSRIQAGHMENVFPYPQALRFNARFAEPACGRISFPPTRLMPNLTATP